MRDPAQQVVFFTHADLQRHYGCSRMWVRRQIQKNRFLEPIEFDSGAGVRPRWSVPLVLEWEDAGLTVPLRRSAAP